MCLGVHVGGTFGTTFRVGRVVDSVKKAIKGGKVRETCVVRDSVVDGGRRWRGDGGGARDSDAGARGGEREDVARVGGGRGDVRCARSMTD